MADNTQQPPNSQPIDLSAGLVQAPSATQNAGTAQGGIDLSAGLVSAPSTPAFSISAVKQPTTMLGKLGQWAEDLQDDLRYGSDITGVGSVLRAMGARGLYAGNSQDVAEFMASLPLGLLKATKGATQVAPQVIGGPGGKTWEGVKNLGGGLLQASTIPAAFIAPEASPLSKEGLLADAAEAASKTSGAITDAAGRVRDAVGPLRESSVQPALQAGLRSTANAVTDEAGVTAPQTPSIYKSLEEAGDAVLARAKSQYAVLDQATGGKVQRFMDRLDNIRQSLNGLTGTEEDIGKEASLLKAQRETSDAMEEAFAEARSNGIDPDTLKVADQNFKQAQSLYDLDTAINRSTSGKPLGVGETKGLPETVDPKKLAPRITALWKSGRLEQAVGPENAADLIDYVGNAAKGQQAAIRNKLILKIALPTAGAALGVGAAAHKLATIAAAAGQ
jgi:hypothetical protein